MTELNCKGSSRPRDQTHVSCIDSQILYPEPPGKPSISYVWNLISDINELIYETETDSQTWKTNLCLPKRKGDEGG